MNVSPLKLGTSRLCTLSIEGKKGSTDFEKLKYQLWADTIVLVVDNFKKTIVAPINKSFTKRDLFQLNEFTGYGCACGGDGAVGMYKLEMNFDEVTSFVTKLKMARFERLLPANVIDLALHYYLDHSTSPTS